MSRRVEIPWKLEAELCEAFAAAARLQGWTVYPETCGWDLLLVAADGLQVGVQAKLRGNVEVIAQAVAPVAFARLYGSNSRNPGQGPDHVAALVPLATREFRDVCAECGVLVFAAWEGYDHDERRRKVCIDAPRPDEKYLRARRRVFPGGRHDLPEFVPDVPAGVPSPVRLTEWKVKAIRLCALLRSRGWLTSADFKAAMEAIE